MTSQAPQTTYEAVLGQVLKKHRESRGFDQAKMSEKVGVTQPYWSRVELGNANPSNAVLRKAAEALGIPHSELLAQVDQVCESAKQRGVRVVYAEDQTQSDWVPILAVAAIAGLIAIVLTKKK